MPDLLWRSLRFVGLVAGVDVAALLIGSTLAGVTCGPDAYECPEAVAMPAALAALATLVVVLRAVAREIDRSARSRPARHLMRPPGEPPHHHHR